MNDGFMSFICIWCTLILIWSGWTDTVLKGKWRSRIVILTGLVLWLIGQSWSLHFPNGEMRVIPVVFPIVVAAFLWIKEGERYRLHIATASFLVGVSVFFMQLMFRLDPILIFMDEKILLAGFTVLLIILTSRIFTHQFILLSFGLSLSDLSFQLYLWQKHGFFSLGTPFHQDIWWMTFSLFFIHFFARHILKLPLSLRRKRVKTTGIARIEEIK